MIIFKLDIYNIINNNIKNKSNFPMHVMNTIKKN